MCHRRLLSVRAMRGCRSIRLHKKVRFASNIHSIHCRSFWMIHCWHSVFEGGMLWMYRLCVDDYHRYIYPVDAKKSRNVHIPGIFHTVNPIANDHYPIYKENTREYCLLKTEKFDTLLMMEVGALLVGKIENRTQDRRLSIAAKKKATSPSEVPRSSS